MQTKHFYFFIFLNLVLISCQDDVLPKPTSYLRLDYPEADYIGFVSKCPFVFDINASAAKNLEIKDNCDITVQYPEMKASVFLTYKKIDNNLEDLLRDAQNITYKHVIKADEIVEIPFMNHKDKVYGMFYEVGGNAATNSQFYVTDSSRHFITGSVYFYTKPNFDSIMPASSYIRDDMKKMMESIRW
jgi:gliding motility-associated lipoprotein GldD